MKHAFWDRLLIILCTLLLLGIAALLLGMVIGFLPATAVMESIGRLTSDRGWRVIMSAASAVLVVLAGLVFWIVLPRRKSRFSTFAIQQTEHGALKISVKALEHLVQKCISQHPELTIVSSAIHSNEETVRVDLRVTLQSDINIPLAISSLQKQIKQYVEACSGVDVDEVRVVVEATVPPVLGTNSPFAIPEMLQPHLPKLPEGGAAPVPESVAKPFSPDSPAKEENKPVAAIFVEDKDTAWMDTKPVDLSEGPGLTPSYQQEPMPDWLLEREPGEHTQAETQADAQDERFETEESADGEARPDTEEGE